MKKGFLTVAALVAALCCRAESPEQPQGERSEWLPSFTTVVADGAFDLLLVKVPDTDAPRILYDLRGSYTTKLDAEVKNRVLHIREKRDARRPTRTRVEVRYNDLSGITVTDAAVTFADTVRRTTMDAVLGGDARLTAVLDVADLDMNVSGRGEVSLSGQARYLTLFASGAKVDAAGLETMSSRIQAQSGAAVAVSVSDRLEGRTSTNGSIRYKGEPKVMSNAMKFMAGDIKPLE